MIVRGAPAIGVAAAMGIALGVRDSQAQNHTGLKRDFDHISEVLAATRPTAVNLFWAIRRMKDKFEQLGEMFHVEHSPSRRSSRNSSPKRSACWWKISPPMKPWEDTAPCCFPPAEVILTHCNAGALATCGYGTALGVIRAAMESGKQLQVFAGETRPFLQGSRLTAWELMKDNIPTTLISDNMAGAMMQQGKIDAVIVGADRIAANGDVANKIGTYTVAILAKEHGIPFYVAAPFSTIDLETAGWQPDPDRTTLFAGSDASGGQADRAGRREGGKSGV